MEQIYPIGKVRLHSIHWAAINKTVPKNDKGNQHTFQSVDSIISFHNPVY